MLFRDNKSFQIDPTFDLISMDQSVEAEMSMMDEYTLSHLENDCDITAYSRRKMLVARLDMIYSPQISI